MSQEKIEIASLSFDTKILLNNVSDISKSIAALREQNKALKDSGEENSAEFVANAARIKALSREYNVLQKEVIKQIDSTGKMISKEEALQRAMKSQNVTIDNALENNKELRAIRRTVNATTEEGAAIIAQINKKIDENTEFIRQNGSAYDQQKMNIGNYKADIKDALSELNLFNGGLSSFIERANEAGGVQNLLVNSIESLTSAIAGLNKQENPVADIVDTLQGGEAATESIDGLTESISNLSGAGDEVSGLADNISGAGEAAGQGVGAFKKLGTAVSGLVKESMAFIMTPIGAAIAVIVGAFAAGKAIFDFNAGLVDMNRQLTALGVSKNNLSQVRSEVQATADTYDKEFKEVANAVDNISKRYNVSMSEANRIVAEGLANGGALNDAFFSNIGEFSTFFEQAGFSAQQFVNIINNDLPQEIREKIPDAVKEASLSLREQTTATRDALVNAFGAAFSDDLLRKVKTGQISVSTALDEISKKAKEANLNQQQQAQLTADVFRGAGEDAGGALVVLEQVSKAATKGLSDSAKASEELRDANERLNKVQAELFEIENFGDLWTKTKAAGIDALASIIEYFADLKKDIQPIIDLVGIYLVQAWEQFKTVIKVVFDLIATNFKIISNTIGTFIQFFSKLLKGDFRGALDALKQGFLNFINIIGDAFGKVKNTIIGFMQAIVQTASPLLEALGLDVDKIKAKLESWKSKTVVVEATVKTTGLDNSQSVANETERIKAELEKQIAEFQKRRDRLAALGQDTYKADLDLLNAQLKLYKKGTPEYEKAYNDLLKLKTDHNSKILSDSAAKLKSEYDLFLAYQEGKQLELADELKLNEQIRDKRLAIAQAEYKAAKDKSAALLKLRADEAKINNDFITKQTDLVVKNAGIELDRIVDSHQKRIDSNKFMNDEILNQEIQRMKDVADAEKDYQKVLYDNNKISYEQYKEAIKRIDEEFDSQKRQTTEEQKKADQERAITDLENKRQTEGVGFLQDIEIQKQMLEIKKAQELAEAERTGADKVLIEKKYANQIRLLDQEAADFKVSQQEQMLGQVADILGRETKTGKAFAIAQATMQTYQSAIAAYRSQLTLDPTSPIRAALAAAAAVAAGIANIKKISDVKVPKAEKGALFNIGGKRHSAGGTKFVGEDGTSFEAEQGELIGVMNRKAAAHFMGFNNSFLNGGSGASASNFFETGGIVTRQSQSAPTFDYAELAREISTANTQLPPPVVLVEDIQVKGKQYIEIRSGAGY